MTMKQLSKQVLERLQTIDTPTICNLIELFEVRPRNNGFMNHHIKACFPEMPPVVGYAATATFRSSGSPNKKDSYASVIEQVERFEELSGPAVVVFQDIDEPVTAATFGDLMCSTYQNFGAVGLVTSGTGRDLEQVRSLGFPVFTNGAICAHGYCHIPQIYVPVHVGGILIYPNDLIHGDENGVTTIPVQITDELVDIHGDFVAAESIVLDLMQQGSASLNAYRKAHAEKNDYIERLRQQVSRKIDHNR